MIVAQTNHAVAGTHRWRLLIVTFATVVGVACATLAPRAHAAAYSVWACADGAGRPLPAVDWKPVRVSNPAGQLTSECGDPAPEYMPSLRGVAMSTISNPHESAGVGWTVEAGPGTSITGLDLWWAASGPSFAYSPGRVEIYAPHTIYRLQGPPEGGFWFGREATVVGKESIAYGDGNRQVHRGLNSPSITLMAWCVSVCKGRSGNGQDFPTSVAHFSAYRVRTVIEDATPPAGFVTGLQEGARVLAPVGVHASASDVGGGVREISLRVDGRVVQRVGSDGPCADVDAGNSDPLEYNRMLPCPGQRSAVLMLSPTDLGDGERHVVSVVATDAAGQDAVLGSARVALAAPRGFFASSTGFFNPDLDVVAARRLNGAHAEPASVRLSFVVGRGERRRFVDRRVVGAGTRPLISGRLTSASGAPIAGARLWRAVAVTDGSWQIAGSPLTTSSTGRVSGSLPSGMPNRHVRLVYFPYSDSSENIQSPTRRLKVRAATTIQTDQGGYSNGDTMRFSGRITTRPVARRQAVYLQTVVRGRWRTFGTTRASSSGRWTMAYRFTATRQLTRYRFRAVVPASEETVSWATGYSRALRVLVSP